MRNKITDIAKAAGVSPTTISRVFGKHPYVKEEVRQRVLEVARKLDYAPKFSGAKNAFAILIGGEGEINMGNFEILMTRAVSREFFKRDCNVQIITSNNLPFIHKNTFQGIIDFSRPFIADFPMFDIPRVTLNHPLEGVHSVASDHSQGLELALDFLASKGHRKIAFICGDAKNWGNAERIKGYQKGLLVNNIEFDANLLVIASSNEIFEATARMMKKKPSAIIISAEGMGLRLAYALYLLDKKIPDDVSVISFEDEYVSPFLTPPHTTISQDLENMAKTVVDTIVEIQSAKPSAPIKNVMLKNKIIERESVKDLS